MLDLWSPEFIETKRRFVAAWVRAFEHSARRVVCRILDDEMRRIREGTE
jgi:hypothetical protein